LQPVILSRDHFMSESTLSGSCLCGAVRYTVTGEERHFYHCHCQRCRKAWDAGEELVRIFKLPEAQRFSNTFCTQCGSRLPRFVEEFQVSFIPAGSLDDEPSIRPEARVFLGSRAAWSCETGDIPCFDEYPG
jgi:hypothetical protein